MPNTFSNFFAMSASGLAAGSTGDKATFAIPFRAEVRRIFITWEGADNNATAASVQFDSIPGSGGSRVNDGGGGTLKHLASLSEIGKYVYKEPTTKVTLKPGDLVVVEVTVAQGAALAFSAGIILEQIPETLANEPNAKVTT